ncbi:hypothetical protein [Rhodococcus sp. OK302]|uniref:hypothetical protein n=1 Tax=Rhodococcus sp. OK302 TaxID=1882769 RepID=UPI000B93C6A9|nr:hypothetical protein [Rhodococcus sp. OK302]
MTVEKSSWHQTSVQWSTASATACPALSEQDDMHPALRMCVDVHASIKAAAVEGLIGGLD